MLKIFNKKKFKINLSWLIFDKVFRASLNILLSVILARGLGPENYGILNYLLAFIFLFSSLSSLGMNQVLTNLIIKSKKINNHEVIMGAYYLRFILSLLSYFVFLILINYLNKENFYYNFSLILGIGIILKSCEIFFSYFEAKSFSKYIVISQSLGIVISAIFIIFSIINKLDLIFIYYGLVVDVFVVFVFVNLFYYSQTQNFLVRFNFSYVKKLILKSLPVLISTISIILYMRIDQIMINNMVGEYDLGLYSVSVRYIEIFHFIPKIIMISILPILLLNKKYVYNLLILNSYIFKLALIIVVIIFFSSEYLIPLIFGDVYQKSVTTTQILSFSIIFVFYGVVNEHWYISKNLQKFYAINVFIGAVMNIILNFFFISKFGINGAAYSTVVTYFFIVFIFDYLNYETRNLLMVKFKSLFKI